MKRAAAWVSVALFLGGCGGESSTDGTGGSGGAVGGASGSGGSGGVSGGSGGVSGGSGGVSGGVSGGSGGVGGGVGGVGGGSGGSGGALAQPECASDGDCKLFSDCCSCLGVPSSETPASCPALCVQDKCSELGAPKQAACVAGRCVTGFDCDSSKVTCKMATPSCNPGQVPLVSGSCWQGSCVPAGECKTVTACAACTGELVCASWVTQLGIQHHCVDVPKSCGGNFTCGCLGPSVCTPPYSTCQDYSGLQGVSCSCPNC